MAEILVPALGESVSEATVAQWMKNVGDAVAVDEPLLELETDKVTLEVNATEAGVLKEIVAQEGDTVEMGAILGMIEAGAAAATPAAPKADAPAAAPAAEAPKAAPAPAAAPAPTAPVATPEIQPGPAARKALTEAQLDPSKVVGSGKEGRITKADVTNFIAGADSAGTSGAPVAVAAASDKPREERVRMPRLRQTIAKRLKEAQDTAAMLTTFNEVDMTNLLALRNEYKEGFQKKHDVKLGFMSFFAKAVIGALKEIPAVNAEIDGTDIIYKNYYDLGIAVGTPSGLVVPVVRDADKKSFADIEADIADYGRRARDGKISMDEMQGGTFTISNGGVYGSLMSTPILNPPQSGILGMHKTQMRPVAIDGKVEIRPMMYLALSYDHRIIDGKEAVTFLVRVKELIEDPRRLILDM